MAVIETRDVVFLGAGCSSWLGHLSTVKTFGFVPTPEHNARRVIHAELRRHLDDARAVSSLRDAVDADLGWVSTVNFDRLIAWVARDNEHVAVAPVVDAVFETAYDVFFEAVVKPRSLPTASWMALLPTQCTRHVTGARLPNLWSLPFHVSVAQSPSYHRYTPFWDAIRPPEAHVAAKQIVGWLNRAAARRAEQRWLASTVRRAPAGPIGRANARRAVRLTLAGRVRPIDLTRRYVRDHGFDFHTSGPRPGTSTLRGAATPDAPPRAA